MNSKGFMAIVLVVCVLLIPQFAKNIKEMIDGYYQSAEGVIPYPALPIIEREINNLRPVIGGKLTNETMDNICALALGRKTSEQVVEELITQRKNIDAIKRSEGPESLLVNNNKNAQTILCAAYIANLPYSFPTLEVLSSQSNSSNGGNSNSTIDNNLKGPVYNGKKLAPDLQLRLAALQTNAEFFSLMAKNIASHPGYDLRRYNKEIRDAFTQRSGEYLLKVNARYKDLTRHSLYLEKISDNEILFAAETAQFHKKMNSTILKVSDVMWYGDNYLHGKQYFIYATNILGN